MKKALKIVLIVVVSVAVILVGTIMVLKHHLTAKYVPHNILEKAPDRISDTIVINPEDPLQKHVTGGIIEGMNTDTENVQTFLGIPYAAPPLGNLRWEPAQDVVPWEGVYEATTNAPNPIQGDNETKPGEYGAEGVPDPDAGYSEDCLYLNVWTNSNGSNMPVVFYIPGGAWVSGSNSVENYNGEYLASQEVVFVSINYRLGIFGWLGADMLAEEDPNGSTGNYGFTDILKALEWVQENIESFGGDPDNVTLYGGSAGGNLIDLLMVSPKAEGLFQRAVSMSYPIDMISPAWDRAFKVSHGNNVIKDKETLEKLRGMSVKELYGQNGMLAAYAFSGPTIDGYYIDMTFAEAIASGRGNLIDYITGFNYNDDYPGTGDAQFCSMIAEENDDIPEGDVLRTVYNAVAKTRAAAEASGGTYILQFEHPTPGPDETQGAVHGGDLQYMIHYFSENRAEWWTDSDFLVGDLASSYFINFCRTGDPNGGGLPLWEQSLGDGSYFVMDEYCRMETIPAEALRKTADYLKETKNYTFLGE